MPVSKSQAKAVRKYDAKTYDKFIVSVKKGEKVKIQEHAAKHGKSLNGFTVEAINEKMNREQPAPDE